MSVEREQFWHLYVNANSLSELALRALSGEIEAMTRDAPPPPQLSEDEIAARLAHDYQTLDLSALDGLDWNPYAEGGAAVAAPESPPQPSAALPGKASATDFAAYLDDAYAHEEQLRQRVDAAYDLADRAAIASLLGRLPADLPPLTTRLAADDLSRWLAVYRADSVPLGALVTSVRALVIAVETRAR